MPPIWVPGVGFFVSAHAAVGYGFDGGRPARVTAKANVKLGWLGGEEHDAPRCHMIISLEKKREMGGGFLLS